MKNSRLEAWVWALSLCLASLALWVTFVAHQRPAVGIDDANIFFVYAENLVHGHGFAYNAGSERVEGVTSMLWTLVCAALFSCGGTERMVLLATATLLLATMGLYLWIVRRLVPPTHRPQVLVLFALLLLSSPSYVTWTVLTLMDTALWGGEVALLACILAFPPSRRLGTSAVALLFGAMILTRPEALLICPAAVVMLALARRDGASVLAWRQALVGALAWGVALAALTTFRLAYFGYPLPNTYYAKVSPSLAYNLAQGWAYLSGYVAGSRVVQAGVLCAIGWSVLAAVRPIRAFRRAGGWRQTLPLSMPTAPEHLALLALLLLLVPVLEGGDHFRLYRFYQPLYPILCLLLAVSVERVGSAGARRIPLRLSPAVLAAVTILFGVLLVPWLGLLAHKVSWWSLRWGSPIQHEFQIAQGELRHGEHLAALFADMDPMPSLGVVTAGGIKRRYPGVVHDLMGLNSVAMGHSPGDRVGEKNHAAFNRDVFFTLRPDVLLAARPTPETAHMGYMVWLRGLLVDPTFLAEYRFARIRCTSPGRAQSVEAYVRKDFLDRAARQSNLVCEVVD